MSETRPQSSVTTHTSVSECTPAHHTWTPYSGPVNFTGPSGLRDHRVKVFDDCQSVGIGDQSKEITSEISYLSRNPPGIQFPQGKKGQAGEIGWGWETLGIVKGI